MSAGTRFAPAGIGPDSWWAWGVAGAALVVATALRPGLDPWVVISVVAIAWGLFAASRAMTPPVSPALDRQTPSGWTGPLVAGALALLLYCPLFLARTGPLGEDKYLLSAALRVLDGQQPYVDFEFNYGPLVLMPFVAWSRWFGYSLTSYYALLAMIEAVTLALLYRGVQHLVPRKAVLLAFAGVAILAVNDNLGLSWISLRRLLPVVLLVVHATSAQRSWGPAVVAALLALQMGISLEFAAATSAAIGVMSLCVSLHERSWRPLLRAAGSGIAGVSLGFLVARAVGVEPVGWIMGTWRVIALRAAGAAGITLQLNANALAALVLLVAGVARAVWHVRRLGRGSLSPGAVLEIGAAIFALIAMKSGLSRADMYHLVPPVMALVAITALTWERAERRPARWAVVLVLATWIPGLVGVARISGSGWWRGARDVLSARPVSERVPAQARGPHVLSGRSENPPSVVALAEFLASPAVRERPVVFYGESWGLDRSTGVAKPRGVYPLDGHLLSDEDGEGIARYLAGQPQGLVVIDERTWRELTGEGSPMPLPATFQLRNARWLSTFLGVWSSAHFAPALAGIQNDGRERWSRTVGRHLPGQYRVLFTASPSLVLERLPS